MIRGLQRRLLGSPVRMGWLAPFCGVWAIRAGVAQAMLAEALSRSTLSVDDFRAAQAMAEDAVRPNETGYPPFVDLRGHVAVVNLAGPLSKQRLLSGPATYGDYAAAFRQLRVDDRVEIPLLKFDSPGGSIAGLDAMADDIRALAESKRVIAYADDCLCSAAYWAASQAGEILANPTASVGAIGVYSVLVDSSAKFRRAGYDVHVVKAGQLKDLGVMGTRITSEHLAERQREIDALGQLFAEAVARGRGISIEQALALRDGRVHVGAQALELGLVDRVMRFDDLLAELGAEPSPDSHDDDDLDLEVDMTQGNTQPTTTSATPRSQPPPAATATPQPAATQTAASAPTAPAATTQTPTTTPAQPTATASPSGLSGAFDKVLGAIGWRRAPEATGEPTEAELQAAIEAAQARLDRGKAEERLANLERQLAAQEVDRALASLGDRVTPAMEKAGLRQTLAQLHTQGHGEGSQYQAVVDALAALPDPALTGGEMASSGLTGEPPRATELSASERQILARNSIDEARTQELLAHFPNALGGE